MLHVAQGLDPGAVDDSEALVAVVQLFVGLVVRLVFVGVLRVILMDNEVVFFDELFEVLLGALVTG